jgi:uncharacterized membrane protein (DUF373 family)
MGSMLPRNWTEVRRDWPALSVYQRFETGVSLALTTIVAVVVVIALGRLTSSVYQKLVVQALNPLDHEVFQAVFGEIMTLLIALEFNHTLTYVLAREKSIVQMRVVLLIAQLAVARKIIVTDLHAESAVWVAGIGLLVLSLAAAYWLTRRAALRPASRPARRTTDR